MNNPKPILLWSVPRSTSTAFERAFIQREDTETLHEPFADAHYFGPERMSDRYSREKCAASDAKDVTFSDVNDLIMQTQSRVGDKLVVVKDMAQCVTDIVRPDRISSRRKANPTVLSDDDLKAFRHTFLIRTPQKTLESYYRATTTVDCADFGAFDPADAGFIELKELLEYTRHLLPEEPVILLDSADLVSQPERALRAFCTALGIAFDPAMLSWKTQRVESFDKWRGWHDQAENSTGFKEVPRKQVELPQSVRDAIEDNMPVYEQLRELKLKI